MRILRRVPAAREEVVDRGERGERGPTRTAARGGSASGERAEAARVERVARCSPRSTAATTPPTTASFANAVAVRRTSCTARRCSGDVRDRRDSPKSNDSFFAGRRPAELHADRDHRGNRGAREYRAGREQRTRGTPPTRRSNVSVPSLAFAALRVSSASAPAAGARTRDQRDRAADQRRRRNHIARQRDIAALAENSRPASALPCECGWDRTRRLTCLRRTVPR